MGDSTEDLSNARRPDDEHTPTSGPPVPISASRIDRLSEEFARLLAQRAPEIGDTLANRYRITELLGAGGMGQVFVAENLAIGSRVAIKVLKAELLWDASFRKRFQQEAEAIAAIEHQNIVRFFNLVVGNPTFLVMEYVRGPTLSAVLKQEERLAPRRAIDLARRLAWGLEAVHHAGVVHRDVKPSNVILGADFEHGEQPKLVDFGVAKVAVNAGDEQLTLAGQVIGTPHYMSPEQITGSKVDARSDVYSLGCVLYHMLTGQPPFNDDEVSSVLSQHIHKKPAPVGQRLPEATPELEAVLARALAKRPKERFTSAAEMARALALLADDRPRPAPERTSRPPRWLAALALVAIAGGAAAWRWLPARSGGQLLLTTQPTGATVELDGKQQPYSTPVALVGLAAGDHRLRIRHGDRDEINRLVNLKSGERVSLQFALPPRSHSISVRTYPFGATLYIDGRLVPGMTPLKAELSDDDFHELRLELDGYETVVKAVTPDDHASSLDFTLQPEREPRGTVIVDSDVTAEVFVDGVSTGLFTPTNDIYLSPGAHTVELRDSTGARRAVTDVLIAAHQSRHLMLTAAHACPPPTETPK